MHQCGPGSSIGIATDYGLDGPGSNSGGDWFSARPDRPWCMSPENPMIVHYIIHQRAMCCKMVSLEMGRIGDPVIWTAT